MYFLVIMAMMAPLVSTALLAADKQTTADIISKTTNFSQARVDTLRWFAITGYQYVGTYPFASSTVTSLNWSVMKTTSAVPDSVQSMAIPANWTIKGNNSQWAICVPSEDRLTVMGLMDQERVAQSKGTVTSMPNVTFGITGQQGAFGFVGPQTAGVNVNVC